MTTFENFTITFGSPRDAVYPVLVRSPAGPAEGSFAIPTTLREPEGGGLATSRLLRSARPDTHDHAAHRKAEPVPAEGDTIEQTEDVGRALFDALLTGSIRSRYDECLGRARDRVRLRVQLQLDLDNPLMAPLAHLPWELLHHFEKRMRVARSETTTLTRYLGIPRPTDWKPVAGKIHVLLVLANPHRDLNLTAERDRIERSIRGARGRLRLTVLEGATFEALKDQLSKEPVHVLHFMGHGDFDGSDGVLVFEPGARDTGRVSGTALGQVLEGRELRLVVLNACRTAEVARREVRDAYAGVAPALVARGVPAVVAMQVPITDQGAVTFADRLYAGLAHGRSLEESVSDGRRDIGDEWAVPVLFSRHDGDLFARTRPHRTVALLAGLGAAVIVILASATLRGVSTREANEIDRLLTDILTKESLRGSSLATLGGKPWSYGSSKRYAIGELAHYLSTTNLRSDRCLDSAAVRRRTSIRQSNELLDAIRRLQQPPRGVLRRATAWILETSSTLASEPRKVRRVVLDSTELGGANFTGLRLDEASLNKACLVGADFRGAILTRARFERADLTHALFVKANLTDAHLTDATIDSTDFSDALMHGVMAQRMKGHRPLFFGARLVGADLSSDTIPDAQFAGADLRCSFLGNADVSDASMRGAQLSWASLSGANVWSVTDWNLVNGFAGARVAERDSSRDMIRRALSDSTNGTALILMPSVWRAKRDSQMLTGGACAPTLVP